MKIRTSPAVVVSLALLNILLFSILLWFVFSIRNNSIKDISESARNEYIPSVAESVSDLNLNSKAFVIYDPRTRSVVAGKNEQLRFAPASSAKIMTALIVLENFSLNQILTAENVWSIEGSKMGLYEGENISVRNLLYGLMLPSGNDAAFVLSSNFPGGGAAFVEAMNKKARDLGLKNTRFFDPAGLDDNNFATAYDLARLASYAIKNNDFAKIVATKNITVADNSGAIIHELQNINVLLGTHGITGIKTGYTDEAGEVLVTSVMNDDKTYIIVVLGSLDRFGDTQKILTNAIDRLRLILY